MALSDLLQAIEEQVGEERLLADQDTASQVAEILERAREDAATLEAELATAPEGDARLEAERERGRARLQAADTVRAEQEEIFATLLAAIRAELAALRGSDRYSALFRALLAQSRSALPSARRLRVDPRDDDLGRSLAGDLRVESTLDTSGGLELADDDGRTVRNTWEERLANAEPLLRREFARRLARTDDDNPPEAR